jgi:hypothetical protein
LTYHETASCLGNTRPRDCQQPRRLFLTRLIALRDAGRHAFSGSLAPLADRRTFLRQRSRSAMRWVVYAKPPFAGPEAVLAYLTRWFPSTTIPAQKTGAHRANATTMQSPDVPQRRPNHSQRQPRSSA